VTHIALTNITQSSMTTRKSDDMTTKYDEKRHTWIPHNKTNN